LASSAAIAAPSMARKNQMAKGMATQAASAELPGFGQKNKGESFDL